jgi:hypothetical protein
MPLSPPRFRCPAGEPDCAAVRARGGARPSSPPSPLRFDCPSAAHTCIVRGCERRGAMCERRRFSPPRVPFGARARAREPPTTPHSRPPAVVLYTTLTHRGRVALKTRSNRRPATASAPITAAHAPRPPSPAERRRRALTRPTALLRRVDRQGRACRPCPLGLMSRTPLCFACASGTKGKPQRRLASPGLHATPLDHLLYPEEPSPRHQPPAAAAAPAAAPHVAATALLAQRCAPVRARPSRPPVYCLQSLCTQP